MTFTRARGWNFPSWPSPTWPSLFNTQTCAGKLFLMKRSACVRASSRRTRAAVSKPAALARATTSAPRTMGRGIAAAVRRHDPRAGHADFDRRHLEKKPGDALDPTAGDYDASHRRCESYADWLGLWLRKIKSHSPSAFAKLRRDEQSTVHNALAGDLPHLCWAQSQMMRNFAMIQSVAAEVTRLKRQIVGA